MTKIYGIDVSHYQGNIDFREVSRDGITFALIRCGYRGYSNGTLNYDAKWKDNVEGALDAGLQVGAYFFSQAISKREAVEEADFVLQAVKGYEITWPIGYDLEYIGEYRTKEVTKAERTTYAIAYLDRIKAAGYQGIHYSSQEGFESNWDTNRIVEAGYPLWAARYGPNNGKENTAYYPVFNGNQAVTIWQYTSVGSVAGVDGNVDRNVAYVDYAGEQPEPEPSEPGKDDYKSMGVYKNGSTIEPVYADTALTVRIGSLDRYEECEYLGKKDNRPIVLYPVDGTTEYKIGFVKWTGGISE